MQLEHSRRRFWINTGLVCAIAAIAACSGQSCSCIQPIKGGFPVAQRRANGVQTRLSSSFLKFVSDNAATIVPGILPGGSTTFNIPPSCASGSTQICCGTPTPMCSLSIDPRTMSLTPGAPDKLSFNAGIILKTVQNLPITASVLGANIHCVISIDTSRTAPTTMTVAGDLQFPIDPTTHLTGLSLVNPSIDNIDTGDVNLNEAGSDALCTLADADFIKSFIVDYLKGQVGTLLNGVTDGALCETCTDVSYCSPGATACTAGNCIGPDGKKCVQTLGIQGTADVGSFFASFSPQTRAHMDFMEAAGGYVTADTGMSLGVLGGAQANPHSACVPVVQAPAAVDAPLSASFTGDVVPGTTTPFHVGIGVHVSHLTTLAYSFWDSGGLCLSIGSDKVAMLSSKTLSIVMPSLADLIHTDDAPMQLAIHPLSPPTFKLGKGTFKMNGTMKVVDDPLLTVGLKDFSIDFYLFIDDRYVRIATLTADLTLPLGLDTDANGSIVLIAGDISSAFTNVRVTNVQLLSESATLLQGTFPTVFAAALGPLLSNIAPFALPTFAGLSISPAVITSTDPDATGAGQFLGIYANVKPTMTDMRSVQTNAQLVSVQTPPTSVFRADQRDGRVPSVTIKVPTSDRPLEWSYAFDHGAWYPFQSADTLTLTDPILWLQGHHVITVRARAVGEPNSLDPSPADLPFIIDSEAPTGDFLVEGNHIVPNVTDLVSTPDMLLYSLNGSDYAHAETLVVPAGVPADKLVVKVRDEAGNVNTIRSHEIVLAQPTTGCELGAGRTGAGDSTRGAFMVLVLLGALLLRRRARFFSLMALALVFAPAAACHKSADASDYLSPTDAIGRFHDAALKDGTIHLAAYDVNFGDLAYATVDVGSLTDPISWLLVDGDDPTAAAIATTPYRHGHTAPGNDVGRYASLALTSGGDPRIAYWDATAHAAKYASGPFPFSTHVIEQGAADGSVEIGQYAAIALDNYDKPVVAYMVVGLGDGTTGYRSELHVAIADNSSPASSSDWTIAIADTTPISCGGRCATGTSCVTTAVVGGVANTNPAISTCVATDLAPCPTACSSSQVCIKATCTSVSAGPVAGGLPAGVGLFAKLVQGVGGKFALAYQDASRGQMKVALATSAGQFLPNVLDGVNPGDDFGQFATATYAADGTLHVAYRDDIANTLLYRSLDPNGAPSAQSVVDDGMRDDGQHPVGASASVIADSTGVAILYQDQATADLLMATQSGSWSHSNVRATDDGSGFSSHGLSDSGQRYYTSWVFDRSMTPLGRLVIDKLP